jgi:Flp pilus assembly protein TadG
MKSRLKTSEHGAILVMTAVMLVGLLGITALAIDVGALYDTRNRMAAAADAAARAGALEYKRGASNSVLTIFARDASEKSGFTHGTDGVTVTINRPPTFGPFAGQSAYVEANVSQSRPTFFMRMLGRTAMMVSARAVAGGLDTPPCVLALGDGNPATSETVVTLTGSSNLDIEGCTMYADGNLTMSGSSYVDADPGGSVYVDGTVTDSSSGGITPAVQDGWLDDPLSGLADPYDSATVPCAGTVGTSYQGHVLRAKTETKDAAALSLQPGIYCDGIVWSGSNPGTLASGTYIIFGGGMKIGSSGLIQGSGVTIFNTGGTGYSLGKIEVTGGNAKVTLSAPSSGTYGGILFFQDRDIASQQDMKVTGGSPDVNLTGTLYLPKADVEYTGGSGGSTAAYTFIISKTLKLSGPSFLRNDTSSLTGGAFLKHYLAE